jgi:outer membrane protein OmpA-like peptidoglycan-associated protein
MKNKTTILITFLMLLTAAITYSQDKGKMAKAKKEYDSYYYSESVKQYERINPKNTEVKRKLADSYRRLGNMKKAEAYYADVTSAQDVQNQDLLAYAEALKSNGKHGEAMVWMEKYNTSVTTDSRSQKHMKDKVYFEKIKEDVGRYKIMELTINSLNADFGPTYFNDKLVFASSREGVKLVKRSYNWNSMPFLDMYSSTINPDGSLAKPEVFAKNMNTKYHEGPAAFSSDNKIMFFTRNNYFHKKAKASKTGVNNLEIFYTTIKGKTWAKETPVPFNNDEYSVGHPSLSSDGKWLYFSSDMPGGKGGSDIYKVEVKEGYGFGEPQNLGDKINTEGNEMFPFILEDGTLFFASNGLPGLGGLDLFIAQVSNSTFNEPMNMGAPLNTTYDDFSLIIDKEMKRGYFSSNRKNGLADDDIYFFEMLKPFTNSKTINGIAKDKQTGEPLSGSIITLLDDSGNKISEVTTGTDGSYSFVVEPEKEYKLVGKKEKFMDNSIPLSTKNLEGKDNLKPEMTLEKMQAFSLYGIVTDSKTKNPLEGVEIILVDNLTSKELEKINTPITGDFRRNLIDTKITDKLNYQIKLKKAGYLSKTVAFNYEITKEGEIKVHEFLHDLSLVKVSAGDDIAKLIDIKPIYFDLGKYIIRSDASSELNKIIKLMNDNPEMVIELGSHTDCRSSYQSNMKLSDNRAKASAEYIKKNITKPERIYGKGFGETKLINGCACEGAVKPSCSEEEHQKNRRTEFIIIKL